MAVSEFEIRRIEKIIEEYIEKNRPPVHIRNELDIAYRIENQSVELFEIRPAFQKANQKIEHAIAKKNRHHCKLKSVIPHSAFVG